ncbi:unnamed protein product [Rotaria sp. Silwood1]|nr:unnamed protein product [Rotaria sp. Silwood1]
MVHVVLQAYKPFSPCTTLTFAGSSNYVAGPSSTPTSVTEADVNGDGKLDIIVANKASNTIGVLLNSGDGTFPAQAVLTQVAGATGPVSVTTADVNSDGKLDIIAAYSTSDNIGVLLNSGTGTFSAAQAVLTQVNSATGPMSVTTADLNGDSKADIIVAYSTSNHVGVLPNSGTGTFPAAQAVLTQVTGATGPVSVTTADVNGDSKADIIAAYSTSNHVGVLPNSGTGTFPAAQAVLIQVAGATGPVSVTTVDVNGDSKADIIAAYSTSNNVGVLLNSGTGTFSAAKASTYGLLANSAPASVTIADANGDGKLDIIVANKDTNNFGVVVGNGDGTFAASQVTYSTGAGTQPVSVVAGDVNGDGRADIAVADSGTNTVGVFLAVCT